MERTPRAQAEREAVFRAALDASETVIAQGAVTVTDRRVLFVWRGRSGWNSDAVAFGEITNWALGRLHDGRPVVRIEHPTHLRVERVPAHRLLGLQWGNAEAEVPHDDVVLQFRGKRDPSFRALVERLQENEVRRGKDFVIEIPGTREERTRGSRALLQHRP